MASRVRVCILSKIPGLAETVMARLPRVNIYSIWDSFDHGRQLSSTEMAALRDAEGLLADPMSLAKRGLVQNMPNLRWMQASWAGVDSMMKALDISKPLPQYTLTRFAGFFGPPMAEYVIGFIIAHERNFAGMMRDQRANRWNAFGHFNFRELPKVTIGVLGLGNIGLEIARLGKMFGMKVWGLVNRLPEKPQHQYVDEYRDIRGLSELLAASDHVCSILPHTSSTIGLLDGDVLQSCANKKSVLINVGRGSVVKIDTILRALDNGWLSHAILDVFETEPLPHDSGLWQHPGVTITLHVAVVSRPEPVADVFVENYINYTEKRDLKYIVNWERGY